jgi:hypothetical protein
MHDRLRTTGGPDLREGGGVTSPRDRTRARVGIQRPAALKARVVLRNLVGAIWLEPYEWPTISVLLTVKVPAKGGA